MVYDFVIISICHHFIYDVHKIIPYAFPCFIVFGCIHPVELSPATVQLCPVYNDQPFLLISRILKTSFSD